MASSPLAPMWTLLLAHSSPSFLSTYGLFILHEVFYWGTYLPFLVLDLMPSFTRYKLQPSKPATRSAIAHCASRVLLNHVLLVLPIILLSHPLFSWLGCETSPSALPSLPTLLLQLAFFFLVEDWAFYWGHRALHSPFLYTHVHAVHHVHAAPFGIAAEYAHPFEVLFLGFATLLGPLLISPHLATIYVYLAARSVQTVECHSGYDLPYSPRKWIPGYGGAEFHDHHHRVHSGNYSSTFIWADWLYGTDGAYRVWRAAVAKLPPGSLERT
ncbi:C-4 methyl sterol oxidase [Chondrus crispus]|uniref:C-4 methyl sterol oxidase n=1 Tax=Chondrus crispus TaxID=2769 RepID=R7QSC6_CHOCR|nr:C-4 methyl sterol oxidase [Chondrus crispus]CDF40295.1 C-4 methyl sterol oxidase [Chondrus crispus]|eukprot:XP_005710589.1 C-4 methyl sterol oxidase [Chondrus crispus]